MSPYIHCHHYLFGLHPSYLRHIPVKPVKHLNDSPVAYLQGVEGRLWRVPTVSKRVIKNIQDRLKRPHFKFLLLPLSISTIQQLPVFTIKQYVKLLTLVNRQLVHVNRARRNGKLNCVPNWKPFRNILIKCQSHVKNHTAMTKNDRNIDSVIKDVHHECDNWDRDMSLYGCNLTFQQIFYYNPFFKSFDNASCQVLTDPAFDLYTFVEDLNNDLINMGNQYLKLMHQYHVRVVMFHQVHASAPDRYKVVNQYAHKLHICHPKLYVRYHGNAIRQMRYTINHIKA